MDPADKSRRQLSRRRDLYRVVEPGSVDGILEGKSHELIEALLRNRAFVTEYASARERWRDGLPAVFPPGTYWLHRFASVPVLET